MLGAWGYSLYIASFLVVDIHPGASAFIVVSGAILGICSAFLWTAQGSLMMAYPIEAQKGMFISIFFTIFNLGGVVGSAVAFGSNFKSTSNSVSKGTYVCFLVLTLVGAFLPLFMANPDKVARTDGTRVNRARNPSWKTEFINLYMALKTDPCIILLFPMFFASNYFNIWQYNDYNGAIFSMRARCLNNAMSWASQIFGSIFIGYFILDRKKLRRRIRAFYGWLLVFFLIFVVHVWAYFYQKTYTRAEEAATDAYKIDIMDKSYSAYVWVMIFYGFLNSTWQTYAYWLMGAMSNDPAKLAVYMNIFLSTWCLTVTGMVIAAPMVYLRVTDQTDVKWDEHSYDASMTIPDAAQQSHADKSLQSAGAAGAWRADAVGTPYMNIFLSTWCLTVAGMVIAAPMVYLRVTDHTDVKWDEHSYDVSMTIPDAAQQVI
ncbi:hypothetical protein AZE42_02475 [Rhizopogon vesiculosus]|uniref:Major facilitator superfamily (MFS) profile domain-containing protein n=1 Tax=Rhizopogon vesiculosus TaxID=180088 RepID=A0A1J8QJH9_9AGAM|nr:hypothetical protein AZE42_02475 [Rhizopogon vesiculosus]